jgi:hypothetical protein
LLERAEELVGYACLTLLDSRKSTCCIARGGGATEAKHVTQKPDIRSGPPSIALRLGHVHHPPAATQVPFHLLVILLYAAAAGSEREKTL